VIERFDPLITARLRLEPITPELARLIAAGVTDGLGAADGWPHEHTKDGVALAIEHGHPAGWLVRFEGEVIGDCGIHRPVDDAGRVEIGYGLAAPYRGRGLGTEAVVAISDWLLAREDVVVVQASTWADNVASRRVLEKAGFTMVGTRVGDCLYERCS
jgi:RimJ/RimL family protein N-acetyltransferase